MTAGVLYYSFPLQDWRLSPEEGRERGGGFFCDDAFGDGGLNHIFHFHAAPVVLDGDDEFVALRFDAQRDRARGFFSGTLDD